MHSPFVSNCSSLESLSCRTTKSTQFKVLKDARDGFFHAERRDAARFPVEETQKLLQKYMQLHVDTGA
jgi:hypothetical protein